MSNVYAAALVPMKADLSCDYKTLAAHCFYLIRKGCKGIALFGTTGEGPSFSVAEKIDVLHRLIEEGLDPKKIILANGSSGIFESVELARVALKVGCEAFLVCPPSFYKNVTDAGVTAYYREIIKRVPKLPILLYHIPQYSGVPISLEVIRQVRSEFPEEVVGIKESEGNLPFVKKILGAFPGFNVYVAKETQIIEALQLGAKGAICGIASLYPELICSLVGRESNPKELDAFFRALNGLPFIPAAKALMEKRHGAAWQVVRPPLAPLDSEQKKAFLKELI